LIEKEKEKKKREKDTIYNIMGKFASRILQTRRIKKIPFSILLGD
jgi:hypothetical protein